MSYQTTFFHARKSIAERIEEELKPLETVFNTMLKQNTLKPETREKIVQNLNAFSLLRAEIKKQPTVQLTQNTTPKTEPKKPYILY